MLVVLWWLLVLPWKLTTWDLFSLSAVKNKNTRKLISRGGKIKKYLTPRITLRLWWLNGLIHTRHFSSVQLLSHVWLFETPRTAARQASLSITDCQSLPKPMSIESVMPFNHLILCHPLLLLPSIFPSIRIFSNESALHIKWPKY